jgi:hypothetical protein
LNALHSARTNFINAESSDKIKRASRHQTRTYADEVYANGEKVFFKRRKTKNWKGPGRVIGTDGYTVLVKFGSQVYRCHRCHVMRKRAQYVDENNPENHPNNAESKKKDEPIGTLHGGKVHPLLCQNLLDALNVINRVGAGNRTQVAARKINQVTK